MRDCWAGSIGPLLAETRPIAAMPAEAERPVLAFVPVESLVTAGRTVEAATVADHREPPRRSEPMDRPLSLGWTLWGDAFL